MPYIGNSQNVGDHVNNFKVLDDISSYTATFNGSAASVVSTTNDTIRVAEHRFLQGQRVTYSNGGGSNIGGLTSGTAYYISLDSANTVKLATSLVNANNNTVINLASVGSGSSHTLTAAFDGVNKEFKLTYGTKDAIVLTAPQLNVAINNVIQRPNLNPLSFTEGFAVKDGNKIIFQSAPQVNDVFWGSITSNTISVFDVEDNAVDNFTGDGSTTNFTLSAIPPNKESILVTLDGVVQHPSDNSTTRAYTIDASVVVFTSAPASGVLIQVRHIGFASPTAPVRSFYGRTGNVTLNNTDDIVTRNINSSGIITASSFSGTFSGAISGTSATFSGDVSIGGTLTYEDVKNVDSVGFITARSGILVQDDATFTGAVGNMVFDKSDSALEFGDNLKASFGTDTGLQIYHNGSSSFIEQTTSGKPLHIKNNGDLVKVTGNNRVEIFDNLIRLRSRDDSETFMVATLNSSVELYHNNVKRLETSSVGVSIPQDLDVDGHTNLDNVSITGVTSFTNSIHLNQAVPEIKFNSTTHENDFRLINYQGNFIIQDEDALANRLVIESNGDCTFQSNIIVDGHIDIDDDGDKLRIGDGNDLQIYHSTFNYIESHNDSEIHINANTGGSVENMAKFKPNGAVELYWNNEKKLQTNYEGIQVYDTTSTQSMVKMNTSSGFAGALYGVGNSVISLLRANLQWGVKVINTGSTEIYHTGNAKKLETTSTGISINQDLDVDGHTNLDNVSIAGVTTFTGRSDHSSSLQMLAGNNIVLLNDANSANCQIDCYGGAGFRLTSYNQTMFTCENGNSTKFYTDSGTSRLEITNGGDVLVNTGTLHIPDALTHLGDTDTKIRFPAADTIQFETAGNVALRIDSSGRVRTDTGTQVSDFDITRSNSTITDVMLVKGNTGNGFIRFQDNDNSCNFTLGVDDGSGAGANSFILYDRVNSAYRIRVDNSGHVLPGADSTTDIGTNSVRWRNVYADTLYGDGSNLTGITQTTINNNADNRVITGSGTANTLNAESTLTFNAGSLVVNSKNSINTSSIITYSPGGDVRWQMSVNNSTGVDLTSKNTSGSYNTYMINAGTFKVRTTGTNTPVERFTVDGNGKTSISVNKDSTALVIDGTSSGTYFGETGGRIEFLMNNEVNQLTGNFAARIAPYLDRSNNGFGLKFDVRHNASTTYKALDITSDYEVLPGSNNTIDLGNASYRWKNVYTNDLNLSNEGKTNDVDGTWGSYTIQEGEDDLFLINKRSGKKYKFNLTEVS